MIKDIIEGNYVSANKKFKEIMLKKLGNAIQEKKLAVAYDMGLLAEAKDEEEGFEKDDGTSGNDEKEMTKEEAINYIIENFEELTEEDKITISENLEIPLNELSKGTLGSYIKKANHEYGLSRRFHNLGNKKEQEKTFQFAKKRKAGINRAVDKLTKEESWTNEEQVNELSKGTVASYVKKAAIDKGHLGQKRAQARELGKDKEVNRIDRKQTKRSMGIHKAVDRLSR